MLKHIPFYGSLMYESFRSGTKPSSGHVLVYGAIEAHSMGEKGCIASNKTIADELGLSQGRVANIISELHSEGWIKVNLKDRNRTSIEPLLTIATPSRKSETLNADVKQASRKRETPLNVDVNIEHSLDYSENTVKAVAEKDTVSVLYFEVAKALGLPVRNYNNVRSAIAKMKGEDTEENLVKYLQFLKERWAGLNYDYKPELNEALDIHAKRLAVISSVKRIAEKSSKQTVVVI